MFPVEIAPGLLRWTAPHPAWNPQAAPGSSGDWEEGVGSVLYELPAAVALIDPLLPSEGLCHTARRFSAWGARRFCER